MNFKNAMVSCIALAGAVGSIFGATSLTTSLDTSTPISVGTSDKKSSEESFVCSNSSDSFAKDESYLLASEYSKKGTADCLFVGCGGII